MELEKQVWQVSSLALSEKLRDLGVKQKSVFEWYCQVGGIILDTDVRGKWILRLADKNIGLGERVAAFTVAELMELMPEKITKKLDEFNEVEWQLVITKELVGYAELYRHYPDECFFYHNSCQLLYKTTADRLAAMLIYLIENGLAK